MNKKLGTKVIILFRMRKEITTNYKFQNTEKYYKHYKIQRNNIIFFN